MKHVLKKEYTGTVKKQTLNKGSKSEHAAIVLETDKGDVFKLRIRGGNPFQIDSSFEPFIGQRVKVNGTLGAKNTGLFVDSAADITPINPPGRKLKPPVPRPRP